MASLRRSVTKYPQLAGLVNRMGTDHDDARAQVHAGFIKSTLGVAQGVQRKGGATGRAQTIELVHEGLFEVGRRRREWDNRHHPLSTFAVTPQPSPTDTYRAAKPPAPA